MIMRTYDPVVAYCMQISTMYVQFYRVGAFYHDCGLLCVYREIVDSVKITDNAYNLYNFLTFIFTLSR